MFANIAMLARKISLLLNVCVKPVLLQSIASHSAGSRIHLISILILLENGLVPLIVAIFSVFCKDSLDAHITKRICSYF